jgi:hypothetical protein
MEEMLRNGDGIAKLAATHPPRRLGSWRTAVQGVLHGYLVQPPERRSLEHRNNLAAGPNIHLLH